MTMTTDRYTKSAIIPKEHFISRSWLAAENARLWPRVWQMACRLEQIPQAGDYFEYKIGRESILLVREEDDSIRAFRNACLHRATRLRTGAGNLDGELRCQYHGWAWNLDGSILEVPDADDFAPACLTRGDLQLPEAHVGQWGGFVFVNLADDPEPLEEFLRPVAEALAPFEVEKMRLIRLRTTVMPCNWKVGLGAFNEAYHIEATHAWDLSGYAAQVTGAPMPTRPNVRDAEGRTLGSYGFLYESFDVHNMMRNAPELLTHSPKLGELGDPKQAALEQARAAQSISLGHQDDIDLIDAMHDVPGDVSSQQFLTDVRRRVGAAGGIDYSHIPDEDVLSAIDYCIYPNLVGPVSAGNWILFRFRPNGDDPDTCLYDVMFMHRFGEGEEAPKVLHEWYPDWTTHNEWGPIIGQDLSNMAVVQAGMHESSFVGLRLNRQEDGLRNHDRWVAQYVGDGDVG